MMFAHVHVVPWTNIFGNIDWVPGRRRSTVDDATSQSHAHDPEHVWIGEISRTHPAATVRILAALAGDDAGVGLAEITSENLPSILADIEASDAVVELDILRQQSDEALIQFETTTPLLLFPIQDSGVPLEMPFTIEEGEAIW